MKLTDEEIADFIRTWRNAFDEELSVAEARAKLTDLLTFFGSVSRSPGPDQAAAETVP
jgi:hypothetical protein